MRTYWWINNQLKNVSKLKPRQKKKKKKSNQEEIKIKDNLKWNRTITKQPSITIHWEQFTSVKDIMSKDKALSLQKIDNNWIPQVHGKRWRKPGVRVWPYKKKEGDRPFLDTILNPENVLRETKPIDITEVKIYNLTWHEVVFNDWTVIVPMASVRCEEKEHFIWRVNDNIPVFKVDRQLPIIPPKKEWKIYIVSQIVAQMCFNRDDLYIPYKVDTRKNNCKWIIQNPFYYLYNNNKMSI